jgi:hypothetical protein
VAGLISQFFRTAAGCFKDSDDLPVRIMGRLSGTRAVIQEGRNSFFQTGRVFPGNFLQKRKVFEKTAPPLADRILAEAYPG